MFVYGKFYFWHIFCTNINRDFLKILVKIQVTYFPLMPKEDCKILKLRRKSSFCFLPKLLGCKSKNCSDNFLLEQSVSCTVCNIMSTRGLEKHKQMYMFSLPTVKH